MLMLGKEKLGVNVVGNVLGQKVGMGMQVNPRNVVNQIERLLQKLPEVQKAKGTVTVKFADGKTRTLNYKYG